MPSGLAERYDFFLSRRGSGASIARDVEERKRRIIAAAERHSLSEQPPPRPFVGVPPRIPVFTGRAEELERLDAILMKNKTAAVTQADDPKAVGRVALQGLGGVGKTT